MKFLMPLFFVLLFIPCTLRAQVFDGYTSAVSKKAVKSIEYIASSIISDSFTPMTGYSSGDSVYTASPSLFTADRLYDSPKIKGRDFLGAALGAGWGRAINDRLMGYVIMAGMGLSGNMEMETYGSTYSSLGNETEYSLFHLSAGAGYTLYKIDFLSLQVYAGLHAQYYSAEIKTDPVPWTAYTVSNTTSGSGLLFGVSGGAAASFSIWNNFFITPYFLYIQNFNRASMTADLELSGMIPASYSEKFNIPPLSSWMTGLSIGYKNDSGFSFSLSAGGLISSLTGFGSKSSSDGLELKSIVLVFTYTRGD